MQCPSPPPRRTAPVVVVPSLRYPAVFTELWHGSRHGSPLRPADLQLYVCFALLLPIGSNPREALSRRLCIGMDKVPAISDTPAGPGCRDPQRSSVSPAASPESLAGGGEPS